MSLLNPGALWLLLLLGVLLFKWYNEKRVARLGAKGWWLVAALVMLVVALTRPALPNEPIDVERSGSDVIVAVDLSFSMQGEDVPPTRLAAAKKLLQELVRHNTTERFGVIGFTTNAIVLSPLTDDGELLLHLFEGLDESLIMTKGTNLQSPLKLARRMSKSARPLLLLLTDGGDGASYAKEAEFARMSGMLVHTVMMATPAGATLKRKDGSLLKDEEGNIVIASRNDAVAQISRATGGEHLQLPNAGELQRLIDDARSDDYRAKTKMVVYDELFYYFIAAAIMAFMLGVTTLEKKVRRGIVWLLALVGIGAQAGMLDFYHLKLAHDYYARESYEAAARQFAAVEGKMARYNEANALYKAGEYEEALSRYGAITSSDRVFKATLFFNRGNCYIRLKEFAKAREAFKKSLTLHATPEAAENLVHIVYAEEQDHMVSGRQKGKQRATDAQEESSASKQGQKRKGGSNMPVDAPAGGGGDGGKKVKSDPRLSLSEGKAKLSSKQYELINKRSIHETRPW